MRKALIILGELTDSDMEWLGRAGNSKTVPTGTIFIEIGQPIDTFYILLEGTASVIIRGKEIARLSSGEVLGEISFIDGRAPTATVVARTEVTALAIPKSQLAAKLQEDTGFAARFYRAIAVFLAHRFRLREADGMLSFDVPTNLLEQAQSPDELDLDVLDRADIAGARFGRLLRRLLPHYGANSGDV